MSNTFEEEIKNATIVHKNVKTIIGKDEIEVEKLAAEFEKTHIVESTKKITERVMFIFYLE